MSRRTRSARRPEPGPPAFSAASQREPELAPVVAVQTSSVPVAGTGGGAGYAKAGFSPLLITRLMQEGRL